MAPAQVIVETAKAKVNLTLRVLGRRPDGYHELVSLVVFADAGDILTLDPDGPDTFAQVGPRASEIAGENLVEKAVRLVRAAAPGVRTGRVHLTKNLPVAAGLGGGSADAAAVVRALARANPKLEQRVDLNGLARALGADVTVCLRQRSALMWGIGEQVIEVPDLPAFALVLANPGLPLSTAAVFRELGTTMLPPAAAVPPAPPGPFPDQASFIAWLRGQGNDLQTTAVRLCPAVSDVLAALTATAGCLYAAQSGSGPTCFGIYAEMAAAELAAAALACRDPAWWVKAAQIGRPGGT